MKPCDTYLILIHICYKKKGHNTFPMVYAYFCGTQTLIFFFRIFLDNRFNHRKGGFGYLLVWNKKQSRRTFATWTLFNI